MKIPVKFQTDWSIPLQWCHNEHIGILITSLMIVYWTIYSRHSSKKTSKLHVTGLWPVNSLHKGPVTWKMFPYDDVIMLSSYLAALSFHDMWHKDVLLFSEKRPSCCLIQSQLSNIWVHLNNFINTFVKIHQANFAKFHLNNMGLFYQDWPLYINGIWFNSLKPGDAYMNH